MKRTSLSTAGGGQSAHLLRRALPLQWPRDPDHVGPDTIDLADPPPWPAGHTAFAAYDHSKEMR